MAPAGRTVQLERRDAFSAGQWVPIDPAIRLQSDTAILLDNPVAGQPQGFYRVHLLAE